MYTVRRITNLGTWRLHNVLGHRNASSFIEALNNTLPEAKLSHKTAIDWITAKDRGYTGRKPNKQTIFFIVQYPKGEVCYSVERWR